MKTFSVAGLRSLLQDPGRRAGHWLETEKGSARIRIAAPSPFAGVAAHAGSTVRPDVLERMALTEGQRLFEEDPHTERFAGLLPVAVAGLSSRFEYDVNRPPAKAVYMKPRDAWGLDVWRKQPDEETVASSLEKYDEFHSLMDAVAEHIIGAYGRGVVFDFHAFNRRCAACGPPDGAGWLAEEKPEFDVCTARIQRGRWADAIEIWKELLGKVTVNGARLRVGENCVFGGGYLAERMAGKYGSSILHLVTEVKKIYMDETSGALFPEVMDALVAGVGRACGLLMKGFREGSV